MIHRRGVVVNQYPISVRMIMSIYTWILQRSRDQAENCAEKVDIEREQENGDDLKSLSKLFAKYILHIQWQNWSSNEIGPLAWKSTRAWDQQSIILLVIFRYLNVQIWKWKWRLMQVQVINPATALSWGNGEQSEPQQSPRAHDDINDMCGSYPICVVLISNDINDMFGSYPIHILGFDWRPF